MGQSVERDSNLENLKEEDEREKKNGGKDEKNDNKIWNAPYGFEEENNLILLHIKFILNNKNKKRKWIDV